MEAPAGLLIQHTRRVLGIGLVAAALVACGDDGAGHLYVTSGQSDEVVRLDATDGSVVRRIPVDRMRVETDEPHAVAVSPDGRHWYVTVAHGQPSLWKFETANDRLVGRVDLHSGGAAMIGMSADGAMAYIPDYDRAGGRTGRVAAVRLHDLAIAGDAEVCASPHDAAVQPGGSVIAIACAASNEVVFLDASDLGMLARIPVPESVDPGAHEAGGHMGVGSRPLSLAWSPDGTVLAVALHGADAIWMLDASGSTLDLIPVGAGPAQVVFADAGRMLTANRRDGTLSIIDVEEGRESRRVALDVAYPHGVVADPTARMAFVAYEGTPESDGGVVGVDLESGEIVWNRQVGRYVLAIAYLPDNDGNR